MYDAWTAYDPVAGGSVTGRLLKGQGGPDNDANKREAISHAAFTVLRTLAPQRRRALIERMRMLGYDPNADTPPAQVGRRAALGDGDRWIAAAPVPCSKRRPSHS
jgi:hypothetical protein